MTAKGAGRTDLGHTRPIMVKLHPDLAAHVEAEAARNYCTVAEVIRRLIIADMRVAGRAKDGGDE